MRISHSYLTDNIGYDLPFICYVVLFLCILTTPVAAENTEIEIGFRIHPKSHVSECSRLFGVKPSNEQLKELGNETDFPKAIESGWVRMEGYDFSRGRQFYPCFQEVVVSFPSQTIFYEFAKSMDACPQYPFYSGADYAFATAVFEYAAKSGDLNLYRIFLSKDGQSTWCASELNAPLFSILRRNLQAFLKVFDGLNESQKRVVVATQYDFNMPLKSQLIPDADIAMLSPSLIDVAREFNELMRKEAQPGTHNNLAE